MKGRVLCVGVAVYSRRATPLAAWTSGLEVANVVADADRSCLVLETGASQRWRYGTFERTPQNRAEATAWEQAKQAVKYVILPTLSFLTWGDSSLGRFLDTVAVLADEEDEGYMCPDMCLRQIWPPYMIGRAM